MERQDEPTSLCVYDIEGHRLYLLLYLSSTLLPRKLIWFNLCAAAAWDPRRKVENS